MSDNLVLYGSTFSNVAGFKAKNTSNTQLTFIRPQGSLNISSNNTYDVSQYASAVVNVSGSSGADAPTFTITYDSNWNQIVSIACDKTFDECESSYDLDGIDYAYVQMTNGQETDPPVLASLVEYLSDQINYNIIFQGGPVAGITIYDNNQCEYSEMPFGGGDYTITIAYNETTEQWEPDKTLSEIQSAHNAGKNIGVSCQNNHLSVVIYYLNNSITYAILDDGISPAKLKVYSLTSQGISLLYDNVVQYTDNATVTENDLLDGVVAFGSTGSVVGTIPTKTSSDLTVSGATVTVPAGYYASQATKSVATGTLANPTATKGSVSNHSISVTPSVQVTGAGYLATTTKTGTAVSVSASELVSGSTTISSNGTYDVTNLASAVVSLSFASISTGTSNPSGGSDGDIYIKMS